ncbi:hypothetical protein [uncultured Porphyromonas sp.]|uniref:hypothetical protein n=1 Tax=uncultured Porphyromonas sp. TaxID=159274 RepID=UPI002637CD30|nr:hypothetical protein [uncultured Porphyromonas sp.]
MLRNKAYYPPKVQKIDERKNSRPIQSDHRREIDRKDLLRNSHHRQYGGGLSV